MKHQCQHRKFDLETLEDRLPLSTFTVLNDLSEGPGSLRQAVLEAKSNPGKDRIEFNIPGAGPFTIDPGLGDLRPASIGMPNPGRDIYTFGNDLEIDGYSQSGASANTLNYGSNASIKIALVGTFRFDNNCQISGLVFNTPWFTLGENCKFSGNYVGVDFNGMNSLPSRGFSCLSNCLIGGNNPSDRNLISSLIVQSNSTNIFGNYFGLSADGLTAVNRKGNWPNLGILIQSNFNAIGGALAGQGNVIAGYSNGNGIEFNSDTRYVEILGNSSEPITNPPGTYVFPFSNPIEPNKQFNMYVYGPNDNLVQGNFFGTNAYGTAANGSQNYVDRPGSVQALSNGCAIYFTGGVNNLIGGLTHASRNIIANNGGAIQITSSATIANKIKGNFIGCDVNSNPLGNQTGIYIFNGSKNNVVGGPEEGSGNMIVYNEAYGVLIDGENSTGNLIDPNKFHGNKGIGIDLGGNGRTANGVPGRPGPNNNQNYPIITKAVFQVIKGVKYISITGSLHGIRNSVHRLEFFSNATTRAIDAQGQFFLGFAKLKTNAAGKVNFTLRYKFQPGKFITATASDSSGNTSEFSPAVLRR